jgi:hypothetical protein
MMVSCYGVHWAPGGIPFLLQPTRSQNLISPRLDSPFVTHIRPKRLRCPHDIDLGTTAEPPDWIQDPLAQAFLPTPRAPDEKPVMVLDPEGRLDGLVMQLSRLCSATEPLMRPLWWKAVHEVRHLYGVSNITPMVWIRAAVSQCDFVFKHLDLGQAHNRRIVIICRDRLPIHANEATLITTELTDVSREPLEAIGAGALRSYMSAGPKH